MIYLSGWFFLSLALTLAFFASLVRCSPAIVEPEGRDIETGKRCRPNFRRGQLGRWLVISRAIF
jgi:hypothetical protein